MRQSSTHPRALAAAAGVAVLLAGCADEPTRPPATGNEVLEASLALGAEERGRLGAALVFARDRSVAALQQREAADRVASAFAALAAQVESGDRAGAERALAAARAALRQYRELTDDDGAAAPDLEVLTLTLDHATALIRSGSAATVTTSEER